MYFLLAALIFLVFLVALAESGFSARNQHEQEKDNEHAPVQQHNQIFCKQHCRYCYSN